MNRYIKTALLAGAAWSALSTFAMAQDAERRTGGGRSRGAMPPDAGAVAVIVVPDRLNVSGTYR